MRKTPIFSTVLAILLLAGALPAAAAPPERSERVVTQTAPDFDNGLSIFWNTTRELRCEDGDVAVPPLPGIEPVEETRIETGQGATIYKFKETAPVELWPLDADGGAGPCTATEQAEEPFAVGTGTFTYKSNDGETGEPPSGTRTAVQIRSLQATVEDASGRLYDYTWRSVRHVDQDGNVGYHVYRATLREKRG